MTLVEDVPAKAVLKHLPLHDWHVAHKAKFITFGNWEVPAYYSGIIDEHRCVRRNSGLFDISHMGQIMVEGHTAKSDIDRWITNSVSKLFDYKALYSPVLNDCGGIIDDVIVYQMTVAAFLIVVNASNIDVDFEWFGAHKSAKTVLRNVSDEMAMFALQGPQSADVASGLSIFPKERMARFSFYQGEKRGVPFWILRTGYTGEDGYEFIIGNDLAADIWEEIMKAGAGKKIQPIGFGARDTLRLEAAYRLHGQDMDISTTPLEAGLGWTVDWDKNDFLGREALLRQKKTGPQKILTGFIMDDRATARHGCEIWSDRECIGYVTSGSYAPTLDKSIGMGYAGHSEADPGRLIQVKIRDKKHRAQIVKLPFYKKEFTK